MAPKFRHLSIPRPRMRVNLSICLLTPPALCRWGVLHSNIYIILKLKRMRGRGTSGACRAASLQLAPP